MVPIPKQHRRSIERLNMSDTHSLNPTGTISLTPTDPPRPAGRYVYQRTLAGHGNVLSDPTRRLQLRRWVSGANPNTPAQQARRAIVRNAVIAWHGFTMPEKAYWKKQGQPRAISGFNAYMSFALKTM